MTDMNAAATNLWSFLRGLRRLNFALTSADLADAVRALELTGATEETMMRNVLRTMWCKTPSDVRLFDMAFLEWVMLLRQPEGQTAPQETYLASIARRRRQEGGVAHTSWLDDSARTVESHQAISLAQGATRRETLEARRLDRLSEEEMRRLMDVYRPKRPLTRAAHITRASTRGRVWNPHDTMRRGREGSEWVRLYYDQSRREPLELTLMLDVSGSTAGYHRPLLQFAHAMMRHERGLKVYAFSTRLTPVTQALKHFHVDRALADVSDVTRHRGGGTRIAESLRGLWERERGRGVSARSTLVLVTDGLEEESGQAVARWADRWNRYLNGRVHWWNPNEVLDPRVLKTPSAQALVRHASYRAVPNFRALIDAWAGLDGLSAL